MKPTILRGALRAPASFALCLAAAVSAPSARAASPDAAPADSPTPMTATQVVEVLDRTIDWYRTLAAQQKAASEPSDLLILYGNRQIASQVVELAFDAARLDADLLAKSPDAKGAAADGGSVLPSGMSHLLEKLDSQTQAVQSELDDTRRRLAAAARAKQADLRAKISELQGELDLLAAKRSALGNLSAFMQSGTGPGAAGGSLKAQIEAMAVALSAATGASAAPAAGAQPPALSLAPPTGTIGTGTGLWSLGEDLYALSQKLGTIAAVDRRTLALQSTVDELRAPLLAHLKALSARGDALATEADTASGAGLDAVRLELDALARDFKQTSQLLIPMSKERILLDQYRRNLKDWHGAVDGQSRAALRALAWRLVLLAVILAAVFALSEVWRRAVLSYARDSRRRHQLLLLRRITLWLLVLLIVSFSFASQLGSIATFAGLLTAGVAVAMQSVLVSIVGYFFLIGKYGIRVGDRVQIGEVTGEVIEVGLVRLYLMELDGHGAPGPTGRVAAFPNSIVFSATGGLFKQIPGVSVAWHEMTLSLPADADHAALKERLQHATEDALSIHREELLRQNQEIQKTTLSASAGEVHAQVQLRFSAAGVEAHVRYPVILKNAAEIDERVSQRLSQAIAQRPAGPA